VSALPPLEGSKVVAVENFIEFCTALQQLISGAYKNPPKTLENRLLPA
jgi:hypothetical protein